MGDCPNDPTHEGEIVSGSGWTSLSRCAVCRAVTDATRKARLDREANEALTAALNGHGIASPETLLQELREIGFDVVRRR